MIVQIDYELGRILDWLDESGQARSTVVIFMSDHGEMPGDHGIVLKGCRLCEGAMHVPLIVSWPGQVAEDNRYDAHVELMDIVPTLCEAAGLDVPYYVQGPSLWPQLRRHRHGASF